MPHRYFRLSLNKDAVSKPVVATPEVYSSIKETGRFTPSDVFQFAWDKFFSGRKTNKVEQVQVQNAGAANSSVAKAK